jgi:hypothetical protein
MQLLIVTGNIRQENYEYIADEMRTHALQLGWKSKFRLALLIAMQVKFASIKWHSCWERPRIRVHSVHVLLFMVQKIRDK